MKNTPFNNPFRAKFKSKNNDTIIVSKRIELILDGAIVVKNLNNQTISINDITPNDSLKIKTSDTEPYKILEIKILPPHTPK
jgi:hypothetical protein